MVLRGWQINGVFSAHHQTPFSIGSGGPLNSAHNTQTADQVKADVANFGGIFDGPYYDPTAFARVNRIPGVDCNINDLSCYGTSGRNILRGPSWVNLDFSLFRTFGITEGLVLEFRAEAFNLTNTPHFNNPVNSVDAGNFMRITGTKYACGEALCGACTVLIDGAAVPSCATPVREVRGKEVLTIEGLARNGNPHPIQEAFIRHDALQCGFCTPGMILTAYHLLAVNPHPSREEIIRRMDGNLCRCGSYDRTVQAIQSASRAMKGVSG
jgi:aerobic-type carbon monoxide dehydrogenase small subunit (CoxS/CutS family)